MKRARIPVTRLPKGQFYWAVDFHIPPTFYNMPNKIYKIRETGHPIDRLHAETGNYFHSRSEAAASLNIPQQ